MAPVGRPKPTSVWGYEEPENNLELKRAFDHADELFAARVSAQIFLTSHSPAFYGLSAPPRASEVWAFNAKPDTSFGTQLVRLEDGAVSTFDEELGLMPLVAPYLNAKIIELDSARKSLAEIQLKLEKFSKPMIIVAGETDAIYLREALQLYSPELYASAEVVAVGKQGAGGSVGAGDQRLLGLVDHWNNKSSLLPGPVFVVLDCDVAKIPESLCEKLAIYRLEKKDGKIASAGIENLLPNSVFTKDVYSIKKKQIEYGGSTETKTLDKMRLCNSVCKLGGSLYSDREVLLQELREVVLIAEKHLVTLGN